MDDEFEVMNGTIAAKLKKVIVYGGSTALLAGTLGAVHVDERGQVVARAQPLPHLWHTHADGVIWPPNQLPVAQVTSGTAIQVPVGTLRLEGLAPSVRGTRPA